MAEGSEAPYQPNRFRKPDPLPDEMKGSPIKKILKSGDLVITGYNMLRPNDPPKFPREPVPDKRPVKLLEAAGFNSAEEWGNSILSKANGQTYLICVDSQGNDVPGCNGKNCYHAQRASRQKTQAESYFEDGIA